MSKDKGKVANRRKTKRHQKRRRKPATEGSGGGGGGGMVSGMRARVQSLAGTGRRNQERGSPLWNFLLWGLLALALVLFVTRRSC